uniref:Sushi domain-containing protein n=1 Tax=Ciona savignyi TaxID=51511 RepID=H2ZR13_CIOSA
MMLSIILACMVAVVSGCDRLVAPKLGSMDCTEGVDVTRCNFTCELWTEMIGADVLTCLPNGEWDNIYPYCEPDYSVCGKKGAPKCPRITREDLRDFERFLDQLSEEDRAELENITLEVTSLISVRAPASSVCKKSLCSFPCVAYPPKIARQCKKCRRKKLIKCSKRASLFG